MTTNDTASTESTQPSKTDETTRETHLARLEELWLDLNQWAAEDERFARMAPELAVRRDHLLGRSAETHERAASLRWLIDREQKRNLLPIFEPVEEKPFVLSED